MEDIKMECDETCTCGCENGNCTCDENCDCGCQNNECKCSE